MKGLIIWLTLLAGGIIGTCLTIIVVCFGIAFPIGIVQEKWGDEPDMIFGLIAYTAIVAGVTWLVLWAFGGAA